MDLVLLDYILPEIDGYYIAQAMREYNSSVPIIMVSGAEIPEERLSVVNHYLSKAEGPEALLKAVVELIHAHESRGLRPRG